MASLHERTLDVPFTSRIAHELNRCRRVVISGALGLALIVGLNAVSGPTAQAQGTSVDLVFVLPPGSNAAQLPLGAQTFQLQIKNASAAPLTNLQVVIRVPPPPAFVVSVSDGASQQGLIDNRTGVWYSTIAQINVGAAATLSVSWKMDCPGKWPITARVGAQKAAIAPTWVGPPNTQCGPDENASPAPASYYELPWPPSTVAPGPSTSSSSTTTIQGQVIATVPSTVPGATTSTLLSLLATSTTANIQPIGQGTTTPGTSTTTTTKLGAATLSFGSAPATATTLGSPTIATAPTTSEPLVEITPETTSAKSKTTKTSTAKGSTGSKTSGGSKTATTLPTGAKTGTTVVTICKTIGGKRYCGPSSSVYKPGQKKAVLSKPGKKVTTKTTR